MASRYRGRTVRTQNFPLLRWERLKGCTEGRARPRTVSAALSLATGAVFKKMRSQPAFPNCQAEGSLIMHSQFSGVKLFSLLPRAKETACYLERHNARISEINILASLREHLRCL